MTSSKNIIKGGAGGHFECNKVYYVHIMKLNGMKRNKLTIKGISTSIDQLFNIIKFVLILIEYL